MTSSTNNAATKVALLVAFVALVAGAAGDYLLRARPGINVLLWFALVIVLVALLRRREGLLFLGEGRWLVVPLLLLAAAFAWRNSRLLLAMDYLVLGFTVAVLVMRSRRGRLRLQGVADYLLAAAAGVLNIILGPLLLLFGDISWKDVPRGSWSPTAVAVVRGLLVAVPLLLVFGLLFCSADAVFGQFAADLFDFELGEIFGHLFLTAVYAWWSAGIIRSLLWANEPDWSMAEAAVKAVSLGGIEMCMALGSLNVLFATFVAIQFRYLFGGAGLVVARTGLTYAEYARRGFFELVAVAALLLPLLLLVHWLLRHEDTRGHRLFRWLAGPLVAMLFVIMGSAFYRMWLYQQEFGMTELRFYVTAFMLWLGAIFIWFVATVLRERREQFMFGVLVSGYVALLLLHAVNPDAYITRYNLAHFRETGSYDAYYNVELSADAVPTLVDAIPELDEEQQKVLAEWSLRRWSRPEHPDWRAWNLGRSRAWQAVEQNRARLEKLAELEAAIYDDTPCARPSVLCRVSGME